MKPPEPGGLNRPFEGLKDLLKQKDSRTEAADPVPRPGPKPPPLAPSEDKLFAEAMAGVQRMDWGNPGCEASRPSASSVQPAPEDAEMGPLQQLVDCGKGFVVSDTPEYMEGVGYRAPPDITQRLHRGDFAVQAHLDLHGLTVEAAWEVFDAFMKESILTGKSAVLIIHGRGLSSTAAPVLKTKVSQWLSSGPWRKWVVAFTSARMCDGGSGASYVLLRRRPLTKRQRSRRAPAR
ncbi:MAG: Smr/MutS family protein [Hyphomicrobiales bacterium]